VFSYIPQQFAWENQKTRHRDKEIKMKRLTKRQREVLDFIKLYINTNKYPPTVREIAKSFEISVKGGYDHIKALEKKNFIKCNFKRSRAIEVLESIIESSEKMAVIPILGTVAAGIPLFADENFDGNVELPPGFLGKGQYFAVKVKGDSMKDAGILDGDVAVINHQEAADNGEIVVAMVDEAVTLKRLFVEKNRIKLKSENLQYPPIYTQNARILGKLTCIIRKY
jgi:repressor LexA